MEQLKTMPIWTDYRSSLYLNTWKDRDLFSLPHSLFYHEIIQIIIGERTKFILVEKRFWNPKLILEYWGHTTPGIFFPYTIRKDLYTLNTKINW